MAFKFKTQKPPQPRVVMALEMKGQRKREQF